MSQQFQLHEDRATFEGSIFMLETHVACSKLDQSISITSLSLTFVRWVSLWLASVLYLSYPWTKMITNGLLAARGTCTNDENGKIERTRSLFVGIISLSGKHEQLVKYSKEYEKNASRACYVFLSANNTEWPRSSSISGVLRLIEHTALHICSCRNVSNVARKCHLHGDNKSIINREPVNKFVRRSPSHFVSHASPTNSIEFERRFLSGWSFISLRWFRFAEGSDATDTSGSGSGVNVAEILGPSRGDRPESSAQDQKFGESVPLRAWAETAAASFGTPTENGKLGEWIFRFFASRVDFTMTRDLFVRQPVAFRWYRDRYVAEVSPIALATDCGP